VVVNAVGGVRLVELTQHDMRNACRGGGLLDADAGAVSTVILAAAGRFGVQLNAHDAVMAKVSGAVGKIADKVEASRQNGTLSAFNAEFKRRRLEAVKSGTRFPSYAGAVARLNRVVAGAAATGGVATPLAIFNEVFGGK
jgi:hypothetical protein